MKQDKDIYNLPYEIETQAKQKPNILEINAKEVIYHFSDGRSEKSSLPVSIWEGRLNYSSPRCKATPYFPDRPLTTLPNATLQFTLRIEKEIENVE